jgi:hypothetical protein
MSTRALELSLNWQTANQQHLAAALTRLQTLLERQAGRPAGADRRDGSPGPDWQPDPPDSSIGHLCAAFGLSAFERDLLLLCAGVELNDAFPALIAAAQGETGRGYPTFALALAALPEAHWSALSPDRPLRYWRLIELPREDSLTRSRLRIDERVLHYLAGVNHLDDRLRSYVEPAPATGDTAYIPSRQTFLEQLVALWQEVGGDAPPPVIQICSREPLDELVAQACAAWGLNLHIMSAGSLPLERQELLALARLWEREAVLGSSALLLACGAADPGERAREDAVLYWIENTHGPLLLHAIEPRASSRRLIITLEPGRPDSLEQEALWHVALEELAAGQEEVIRRLVGQFDLGAPAIFAISARVQLGSGRAFKDRALGDALWDACRQQARPQFGGLATPIRPAATWEDLVLPEVQLQVLHEIAVHVRHQLTVYEDWGFAARSERGLGISALFAGSSGTGKTMAAEVLANELELDLYRIDLSQVVSKYIGETEKNLSGVFDAAESGGAILLFDEADALFGRRSEVKDSHDRYANIEISYLLQRMEAYRGLAILTTNMRSALDHAFLRRIRFIVNFPFPDAPQRAEIWRRIFPARTPTRGLDVQKLARLNVTGGNIRNIALYGAFLAADDRQPVGMEHLLRAARVEYAKLDRPLTAAEIKDW